MPTPQAPIGSGFGAATTAAEVIKGIDLTGKIVIVTGGYSGTLPLHPSARLALHPLQRLTTSHVPIRACDGMISGRPIIHREQVIAALTDASPVPQGE